MKKRREEKELSSLEMLPRKGVYTLIIFLNRKIRLKIEKSGCFNLPKGYCVYTGSAVGDGAVGLNGRVSRHLKKEKVKHWHIDYLLANRNASVVAVVAAESKVNKECEINSVIKDIERAVVPAAGFGASDCKQNCQSHLICLGEENVNERIFSVYKHFFGSTAVLISLEERN